MGRVLGKFSRATTLNAIRTANTSLGVTSSGADPITVPDKVDIVIPKGSDFQVVFKHNVLHSFFATLEPEELTAFKLNIVRDFGEKALEFFKNKGYEEFWLFFHSDKGYLLFEDSINTPPYKILLSEIEGFKSRFSFDIKLKDSAGVEHASSATLKYNSTVTIPMKSYAFSAPLNDSLTVAKDGFTPNETVFYHLTDDSGKTVPLNVSASSDAAVSLSQIAISSVSIDRSDLKIYNNTLYQILQYGLQNKIN